MRVYHITVESLSSFGSAGYEKSQDLAVKVLTLRLDFVKVCKYDGILRAYLFFENAAAAIPAALDSGLRPHLRKEQWSAPRSRS